MNTLEDVIKEAILHHENNPTHGVNCACMDVCIQRIREIISKFVCSDTAEMWRLQHVIRSAIRV